MAELGRVYEDGDELVREGEVGDTMYVIQDGTVDIVSGRDGDEVHLGEAGPGEIIGEMALFDRDVRSATARARGRVRAITVDRSTFMQRVTEDPSLALRIVRAMSHRIRALDAELTRLRGGA
ncbi:MAG: cyclic nucleotide-binding domain-containing protein [Planctomycetota bacterium]|jgi:CRP-like cAMP-binding protein